MRLKLLLTLFIYIFSFSLSAQDLKLVDGEINSGKIYTSCSFDDFDELCFLDTGAARTSIENNDFSKQYESLRTTEAGGASGARLSCDVINVDDFKMGEVVIEDYETLRCELGKNGKAQESTIGITAFKGRSVYFNFDENKLEYDVDLPVEGLQKLTVHSRGHISIPIQIGGLKSQAVWDTGAGLSVVDSKYVKENPKLFKFIKKIDNGYDSTGNKVEMGLYEAKSIVIGNVSFNDIYVLELSFEPFREALSPDVAFIIGYNIITKSNWLFDLKNNQWSIE